MEGVKTRELLDDPGKRISNYSPGMGQLVPGSTIVTNLPVLIFLRSGVCAFNATAPDTKMNINNNLIS